MKRISFSIPWPFDGTEMRALLSFIFQVALLSYLGFYLIESLSPGFVSHYFNLNIILYTAIAAGVLASIWPQLVPEAKRDKKIGWRDVVGIALLVLLTIAIVWYKTRNIGWLTVVIAPLSGLIVLGLALLVYYDKPEDVDRHE